MSAADGMRGGVLTTPDGCRLAYVAAGTGPTVVFAHGGLVRASSWIGVADMLCDRFTCVLFDQRGHGASDWGGGPDVAKAAADLLFVVDQVGPVHAVVGHSYGALVALEAARQAAPGAIPRLAIYEPPLSVGGPIMTADVLDRVDAAVAAGDYEHALLLHLGSESGGLSEDEVQAFRGNPMFRPTYTELVIQSPSIAMLRSCLPLDSARPYRSVQAPTLVLLGTASPHEPFRTSAEALLAAMPDVRLAMLEGQSHTALLMAPHLVADALGSFL